MPIPAQIGGGRGVATCIAQSRWFQPDGSSGRLIKYASQQEAAAAQRKKGRAAGGGGRAGGGDRRPERPPQQRFASVEDHWRKLTPEQRHELLRLPVRELLAGAAPTV